MSKEQLKLWDSLSKKSTLIEVQKYIETVTKMRGFANDTIEQKMLLLTEEVGELAKAIRKEATTMIIDDDKIKNYSKIEGEIADVFIVLCSICNKLGIDLYTSLKEKERENINRSWSK